MNVKLAVQEKFNPASITWLNTMGAPDSLYCDYFDISQYETVEYVTFFINGQKMTIEEAEIFLGEDYTVAFTSNFFEYKRITGFEIETDSSKLLIGNKGGNEEKKLQVNVGDLVGLEVIGEDNYIEKISLVEQVCSSTEETWDNFYDEEETNMTGAIVISVVFSLVCCCTFGGLTWFCCAKCKSK